MIERVLTIGAYGFTERTLVEALKAAGTDLFIDIRARRGMRGSAYAFANAARLQASLQAAGIKYAHAKELAPPEEVRDAQRQADAASGVAKRDRARLSEALVLAYQRPCAHGPRCQDPAARPHRTEAARLSDPADADFAGGRSCAATRRVFFSPVL